MVTLKRRIVFVDDEPNVLRSIRRMLHSMRDEWEMRFVESGHEALDVLAKESFDVIVTDMRMPQMDGTQLLTEVKRHYPDVVRIVLSGHSDQKMILKSVRLAHQYLSKPSDAETFTLTVSRACALRDLLTQDSLKGVISHMDSLPSLPSLYAEIMNELQSTDASIQKISQIISKDIAMTTKILQLVNSAFFGIPRHISEPKQAVNLLGLDTIKALVLTMEVFSKFDQTKLAGFDIEALWEHSIRTGEFVKRIAKAEALEKTLADDAYMAGLLHDIGKLVLVDNFSDKYKEVLELANHEKINLFEAENQLLGASHSAVGAYLLGLWGLPDTIMEAVAFHHNPRNFPVQTFSPITAVHIGDALEHGKGQITQSTESLLDNEYLKDLGLFERLAAWQDLYNQMEQENISNE